MKQQSNWCERLPGPEQATADAIAEWLSPIPWQLFITLTFPWNVTSETADRKLKEFINSLERDLKTRICYAAGRESQTKAGYSVPWHFHVLLASLEAVPVALVEASWLRLVARIHADPGEQDCIDVQPFNSQLRGAEYIVKQIARGGET